MYSKCLVVSKSCNSDFIKYVCPFLLTLQPGPAAEICFQTLFTNRILPPNKLSSIVAQHSVLNCLKITGDIQTQTLGLPQETYSWSGNLINEFARKVCKSGALNFKRANTSTKVNDHNLQNLFGKS